MAIVRSHTVEQTNEKAKKMQVHKETTDDNVPTGAFLTTTFLDVVEEHYNRSTKDESIEDAKKLLSRTKQFKTERQISKVRKIMSARPKAANKAQKQRAVSYPSAALGKVTYHSVYKNIYMQNVKDEIVAREVTDTLDGIGIKDLLAILKKDEDTRHGSNASAKAFTPLTDFSECLI